MTRETSDMMFARYLTDHLRKQQKPRGTTDKDAVIRTHLHYTDPQAREVLTVFGQEKPGLFYNYSDRLWQWNWDKVEEGFKRAAEKAKPHTTRYYEEMLKHFHGTETVDLQHILLGCNLSNGYDYLVFGYTYEKEEPEP